ncbi:hypothetical protein PQI07_24625 [Methylobacterium sp. 092160098-2]|uniref:hypothetical protein n=1 Tax=Methylobacterium sp. 092160098-2 TaxID=3025129 RepID=UPI002381CFCE|nr:hypothetical protein [Methylobacterium sp. 092160098-2]MDE4913861.1 hypothetical protein [Methylobacterium sp. 092160098-2]
MSSPLSRTLNRGGQGPAALRRGRSDPRQLASHFGEEPGAQGSTVAIDHWSIEVVIWREPQLQQHAVHAAPERGTIHP